MNSTAEHRLPFPLTSALIPVLALIALTGGALLRLSPSSIDWSEPFLFVFLVLLGAPVVLKTGRVLLQGAFTADFVAALAILVAIALREAVAGLVIVLMQTGGELLERYAEGRASRAVSALEADAPRIAHRLRDDDSIEDIEVAEVIVGDLLLIRPGEMIPTDGTVESGTSSLDSSRVTGEPLPDRVDRGDAVRSGVVNRESAFVLRATAAAGESLYARIIELVRTAQTEKAPIQRLADRWAIWFTPLTLVTCGLAWFISGDPDRVLAVLVVATPCPLLIATPVAVMGGINRAARRQIVIRNGTALEQLAKIDTAIFDKTGTLTIGRPVVAGVYPVDGVDGDQLLRLAASVELGSGHQLARSIVDAAIERGLKVPRPEEVLEYPGRGASGSVDGYKVTIGSASLVSQLHPAVAESISRAADSEAPGLRAYIAVEGRADQGMSLRMGSVAFADQIRPGIRSFIQRLGRLGIRRTLMLSGDRKANVAAIARETGIDEALGDLLPNDKVEKVRDLEGRGSRVLMVGDGTNDAPALSAASVGIALAAHGGGISAEAAGIVLVADDVTRVEDAIRIGQSTVRIARQSIVAGLSLSGVAMIAAALGQIEPTVGALLQEGIDVAVILNALRAARL